jgi:acyl-coenzyme A synthetase/AMP-(fatty) acid ligase
MLVYKYDLGMEMMMNEKERGLLKIAEESGRVIRKTMEHGANYPYARLVREAGVENSGSLMDVMFVWMTGQDVGSGGGYSEQSGFGSKNPFSVHCGEENLLIAEATCFGKERLLEVVSGMFGLTGKNQDFCGSRPLYSSLQEEEWGTGQTLSLMPATFQATVAKYVKMKEGLRLVDLGHIAKAKAGSVVGLHMRRSEMLIRLVYSVVVQGMAFLPLDSQYNAEVVGYRLRDSEAVVCCVDEWKVVGGVGRLAVAKELKQRRAKAGDVSCFREDIGYMFYTSGSTGNPKGVVILQRNVPNLAQWVKYVSFQTCGLDLVLFQSSISFDILLLYLLLGILSETRCGIVPESVSPSLDLLVQCCITMKVTIFFMVQSQVLLACERSDFMKHDLFKWAMIGGETFSIGLLNKIETLSAEVWAVYGPTETVMYASSFMVQETSLLGATSVPIGKTFPNLKFSTGLGSLSIHGPQVSSGYKDLSLKSKSAFVLDASVNDGGSRAYNTGDQAQFLETGDLEFLGRNDDQVKVSGQRVELGAVESGVLSCRGVKGCAVVVIVDQNTGYKSLAAFAVVEDTDNERVTSGSIREEVSGKVARHEVPHRIMVVDRIPLTTAGKADRAALRKIIALSTKDKSVGDNRSLNRLSGKDGRLMIEIVSEAMEKVLGRNLEVGHIVSGRSFWELGGTSLMAMELDSLLQEKTGVKIGVTQMMKEGSVEGLSLLILRKVGKNLRRTEEVIESSTGKNLNLGCFSLNIFPVPERITYFRSSEKALTCLFKWDFSEKEFFSHLKVCMERHELLHAEFRKIENQGFFFIDSFNFDSWLDPINDVFLAENNEFETLRVISRFIPLLQGKRRNNFFDFKLLKSVNDTHVLLYFSHAIYGSLIGNIIKEISTCQNHFSQASKPYREFLCENPSLFRREPFHVQNWWKGEGVATNVFSSWVDASNVFSSPKKFPQGICLLLCVATCLLKCTSKPKISLCFLWSEDVDGYGVKLLSLVFCRKELLSKTPRELIDHTFAMIEESLNHNFDVTEIPVFVNIVAKNPLGRDIVGIYRPRKICEFDPPNTMLSIFSCSSHLGVSLRKTVLAIEAQCFLDEMKAAESHLRSSNRPAHILSPSVALEMQEEEWNESFRVDKIITRRGMDSVLTSNFQRVAVRSSEKSFRFDQIKVLISSAISFFQENLHAVSKDCVLLRIQEKFLFLVASFSIMYMGFGFSVPLGENSSSRGFLVGGSEWRKTYPDEISLISFQHQNVKSFDRSWMLPARGYMKIEQGSNGKDLFLSMNDLKRLGDDEETTFGLLILPFQIPVSWVLWGLGICIDLTKKESSRFLQHGTRIINRDTGKRCFAGFEGVPLVETEDSRNFYNTFKNDGYSSLIFLKRCFAQRGSRKLFFRERNEKDPK